MSNDRLNSEFIVLTVCPEIIFVPVLFGSGKNVSNSNMPALSALVPVGCHNA